MHRRRKFVAAVGVVAASIIVGLQDNPAQATGSTGAITDADGVDYDAACLDPVLPSTSTPAADSVASPGGTSCIATTYDGSTDSSDIRSVSLESTSTGRLKASMTVDGPIPAPGSTNQAALDGINGTTTYLDYFVLFQNKDKQHGADNPSGGCTTGLNMRAADRKGHWADGHQYFLRYGVEFRNDRWVHTLDVGTWDTDPTGGIVPIPIAQNAGSGWTSVQAAMAGRWSASLTGSGPTTIDMEVSGEVREDDPNCRVPSGYFVWDMASNNPGPFSGAGYTGDTIANVKGLTLVDQVIGVLSYNGISDVTAGNSTANVLNTKIPGVSMTFGALPGTQHSIANGPFCRFYVAGSPINNPLATLQPNQPCQIDDDAVERGTLTAEFWETSYGFTF